MISMPGKLQFRVIKICLVILSFVFIYYHINQEDVLHQLTLLYTRLLNESTLAWQLCLVLMLMIINWLTEAWKWKLLAGLLLQRTMIQSVRGVLAGLVVSFFTPNRSGEFAGRIINMPSGFRVRGAILSFIGSMAQMLITLLAGFIALWFVLDHVNELNPIMKKWIMAGMAAMVLVCHILYFFIARYMHHLPQKGRFAEYIAGLQKFFQP